MMLRIALSLALLFSLLFFLRAFRLLLAHAAAAFFGRPAGRAGGRPAVEAEMVRDPVCGAWVDRRVALSGRRGSERLAVCSEKCLRELEAGVKP